MSEYKLTQLEQETIILYNQGEKDVEIYTHDPVLIKKLKERPQIARLKCVNKFGGYTYIVPKNELRIGFKMHYTGEALKKRRSQVDKMNVARKGREVSKNNSQTER